MTGHHQSAVALARRLRPLTLMDARTSYQQLKALDCATIGKHSRVGLNALDFFLLQHRLKAKTKRHVSFYAATKDPALLAYLDGKIQQVKKTAVAQLTADKRLTLRYSVFQLYYGSINQFRPSEAKRIYCLFKPKHGVLDFSAGWGGRCLAAMAYGVPYIGIDVNKNMAGAYKALVAALDPAAPVVMRFLAAETVDFRQFQYDLVFTSPPYFMLEEYEQMPKYGSKQGFLDKFFRPVVQAAWANLKSPGHLALNMPKEMYDSVKDLLPPLWKRLQLPVKNRHGTDAILGRKIGAITERPRTEGIYVWRKGPILSKLY